MEFRKIIDPREFTRKQDLPERELSTRENDPYFYLFDYSNSQGEISNYLTDLHEIVPTYKPKDPRLAGIQKFAFEEKDNIFHFFKLIHESGLLVADSARTNSPLLKNTIQLNHDLVTAADQCVQQGIGKHKLEFNPDHNTNQGIVNELDIWIEELSKVRAYITDNKLDTELGGSRATGLYMSLFATLTHDQSASVFLGYPLTIEERRNMKGQIHEVYKKNLYESNILMKIIEKARSDDGTQAERFQLPSMIAEFIATSKDPTLKFLLVNAFGNRLKTLTESKSQSQFNKDALDLPAKGNKGNAFSSMIVDGLLISSVTDSSINLEMAQALISGINVDLNVMRKHKQSTETNIKNISPFLKKIFLFHSYMAQHVFHPALDSSKRNNEFDKKFSNFIEHLSPTSLQLLGFCLLQNLRISPQILFALHQSSSQAHKNFPVVPAFYEISDDYDLALDNLNEMTFLKKFTKHLPAITKSIRQRFSNSKSIEHLINGFLKYDQADEYLESVKTNLGIESNEQIDSLEVPEEEPIPVQVLQEYISVFDRYSSIEISKDSLPYKWNIHTVKCIPDANRKGVYVLLAHPIEKGVQYAISAHISLEGEFELILPFSIKEKDAKLLSFFRSLVTIGLNDFIKQYQQEILPNQIDEANEFLEQF